MDTMPYIGVCKVCNYGMLEIHYNFIKEVYSIMCDECLAEWTNPEDALKKVNGFRKTYTKAEVRVATIEEIKEVGWEKYVLK